MKEYKRNIRRQMGRGTAFLDRESGGYATSVASWGGPAIREIQLGISPAGATALSCAEQTFTVPGLLATERIAYVTQVSPSSAASFVSTGTSNIGYGGFHVQAISVMGILFCTAGTSAGTITSGTSTNGTTIAIGVAQARGA